MMHMAGPRTIWNVGKSKWINELTGSKACIEIRFGGLLALCGLKTSDAP
jgi:hypothetical protein